LRFYDRLIGGFALSLVIGIPLATIIVFSRLAERVLYPPMIASQAIPKVAVAPLFVVWMGRLSSSPSWSHLGHRHAAVHTD
jgi:ABC-type nitrate/sulfonate/bicarbonate transport system permease component